MQVIGVSVGFNFMTDLVEKANILVEALPYISKFYNKIFVIKYGGSVVFDKKANQDLIKDISFLKAIGIKIIIVHGGGKNINQELEIHNIKPNFVDGIRKTDKQTMEIAEMVLSGKVNKDIVADFQMQGINAVGLSCKDGFTIEAVKKDDNLGFVGEIKNVNPKLINSLLDNNFVPVLSPVCCDKAGNTYNVNADEVAVKMAVATGAEKLIFLSDIDGVFGDINDKRSLIGKIHINEVDSLIKEQKITGGMIPKIKSCVEGIEKGINAVHIINGKTKHAMLLEIYTNNGIGTIIEK